MPIFNVGWFSAIHDLRIEKKVILKKGRCGTIRIFAEKELRDFLEEQRNKIILSIENEADDYLLSVNEEDYINYKKSEGLIEPLKIF